MLQEAQKALQLTKEDLKQSEVILKQKGNVFYLLLNRKANTFTRDFVQLIGKRLSQIEKVQGATALVTVSLSKLFSGGLDLHYVSSLPAQSQGQFVQEFISLLGRIAVLPFPTIALVKGGAIAGGGMFAFAHDHIFVADKALFGFNEVDLGLPLPPGMMEIIKKRISDYRVLRDMTNYGRRLTEQQSLKAGVIDGIWKSTQAMEKLQEKAQSLADYGTNKANFKKIKQEQFKIVVAACSYDSFKNGKKQVVPLFPKL